MKKDELPPLPFLAFVRRFGWVVVDREWGEGVRCFGTRPRAGVIYQREIIATAALPDAPKEAR